jgi:hypothetical protein
MVQLPETVRPTIGSPAKARTYDGAQGSATLRQLSDAANPATRTFEARYVLHGGPAQAPLGPPSPSLWRRRAIWWRRRCRWAQSAMLRAGGLGAARWYGSVGPLAPGPYCRAGRETATIDAGLRPGERIVAMGAHMLHDGQTVRVSAK